MNLYTYIGWLQRQLGDVVGGAVSQDQMSPRTGDPRTIRSPGHRVLAPAVAHWDSMSDHPIWGG